MKTIILNGQNLSFTKKAEVFSNLYRNQFSADSEISLQTSKSIWSAVKNNPDFPYTFENILGIFAVGLITEKDIRDFLNVVQKNATFCSRFWTCVLSSDQEKCPIDEFVFAGKEETLTRANVTDVGYKKFLDYVLSDQFLAQLFLPDFKNIVDKLTANQLKELMHLQPRLTPLILKNKNLAKTLAENLTPHEAVVLSTPKLLEDSFDRFQEQDLIFQTMFQFMLNYRRDVVKSILDAIHSPGRRLSDYETRFMVFFYKPKMKWMSDLLEKDKDLLPTVASSDMNSMKNLVQISPDPLEFLSNVLSKFYKKLPAEFCNNFVDLLAFILQDESLVSESKIRSILNRKIAFSRVGEPSFSDFKVSSLVRLVLTDFIAAIEKREEQTPKKLRAQFDLFENAEIRKSIDLTSENLKACLNSEYKLFFERVTATNDDLWSLFNKFSESEKNEFYEKSEWLRERKKLDNFFYKDKGIFFAVPAGSISIWAVYVITSNKKIWEQFLTACKNHPHVLENMDSLLTFCVKNNKSLKELMNDQEFALKSLEEKSRWPFVAQVLAPSQLMSVLLSLNDKEVNNTESNTPSVAFKYLQFLLREPYYRAKFLTEINTANIHVFSRFIVEVSQETFFTPKFFADVLRCTYNAYEQCDLIESLKDHFELINNLIMSADNLFALGRCELFNEILKRYAGQLTSSSIVKLLGSDAFEFLDNFMREFFVAEPSKMLSILDEIDQKGVRLNGTVLERLKHFATDIKFYANLEPRQIILLELAERPECRAILQKATRSIIKAVEAHSFCENYVVTIFRKDLPLFYEALYFYMTYGEKGAEVITRIYESLVEVSEFSIKVVLGLLTIDDKTFPHWAKIKQMAIQFLTHSSERVLDGFLADEHVDFVNLSHEQLVDFVSSVKNRLATIDLRTKDIIRLLRLETDEVNSIIIPRVTQAWLIDLLLHEDYGKDLLNPLQQVLISYLEDQSFAQQFLERDPKLVVVRQLVKCGNPRIEMAALNSLKMYHPDHSLSHSGEMSLQDEKSSTAKLLQVFGQPEQVHDNGKQEMPVELIDEASRTDIQTLEQTPLHDDSNVHEEPENTTLGI